MTENETRSELVTLRMKPALRERIKADALESNETESGIIRAILAMYYRNR